jgi:hypothetical protein
MLAKPDYPVGTNPFKQDKKPAAPAAKKPGFFEALSNANKARNDYRSDRRTARDAVKSGALAPVKVTAQKKPVPAPAKPAPAKPAAQTYGTKASDADRARMNAKYKNAGAADSLKPVTVTAQKKPVPAPAKPAPAKAAAPAPRAAAPAPKKSNAGTAADMLGLSEDNAVMRNLRAKQAQGLNKGGLVKGKPKKGGKC